MNLYDTKKQKLFNMAEVNEECDGVVETLDWEQLRSQSIP